MSPPAMAVDRISDLTDELLCQILTCLPIKQAFTTTILSKRWTPLCYSLPILTFDDETVQNSDAFERFCSFIDTLMISPRVANQSLKTFHLKCHSVIYSSHERQNNFDAWVEAAKQRRVEEFHLIMNNATLNATIFTSQTLVVLKLEKVEIEAEKLRVDLPSLKTLHLKHVCFENQNDIKKLLKASPVLEDLHTFYPRYIRCEEKKKGKRSKSLIMSKLIRADIGSIDVPFTAIQNVKFLCLRRVQEMKVEEIFKNIPVFQNLIHVELVFHGFFHGWDGVVDLLRHCPRLQIIFIKKWSTSLDKDWDCPILGIGCFESHLRSCNISNFEGSENDMRFATYILQNARLLQDMKINVNALASNGMQKQQIIEELSSCPRMSPGCKLSF